LGAEGVVELAWVVPVEHLDNALEGNWQLSQSGSISRLVEEMVVVRWLNVTDLEDWSHR